MCRGLRVYDRLVVLAWALIIIDRSTELGLPILNFVVVDCNCPKPDP